MNPSIMGRMGICVYCGGSTHVVVGQVVEHGIRWDTHTCTRCGRASRIHERVMSPLRLSRATG